MRRHLTIGTVAAALLGMACPPAAVLGMPGPPAARHKLYHLRKVPKFRVGDKAVEKQTDSEVFSIAAEGKIVQETSDRKESHCIHEVLEVDKAGKIQALRVTVVSAKAHILVKGMGSGKKDVAIEKIHFVARRKGLQFRADTTTVVSEKAVKLKPSQIWLLKEFCREGISFAAYSEEDVMLLSAGLVPVGHSWKASRKVLDEWVKAIPSLKAVGGKALSATLKLTSVKDDIVLVKGDVLLEANLPGTKLKVKIPAVFAANIDTGSGRWAGYSASIAFSHKNEGATFRLDGRRKQTSSFTPGKGKASALPAKLFKLGWKPPGKDTNNHKDAAKGFSLNVPAGYAAQQVKPGDGKLAEFESKKDATITVSESRWSLPVDVEEFVRGYGAGMRRAMPDYKLVGRESLVLPGNVPAVLLVGQIGERDLTFLRVVAFDGPRVLSVSGDALTANERELAEMRKAMKTLRVFKPDIPKAP